MSAFTNSGHSNALEITDMTGRFRPRLCKNVRDFDANGTAHHIGSARVEANSLTPTLVRFQSIFRSSLPPTFLILPFYTASATTGHSYLLSNPEFKAGEGSESNVKLPVTWQEPVKLHGLGIRSNDGFACCRSPSRSRNPRRPRCSSLGTSNCRVRS